MKQTDANTARLMLIADCGSTKIDWCAINYTPDDLEPELRFETPGMNAVMLSREEIAARMLSELQPAIADIAPRIDAVYFYGAGCVSEAVCENVAEALRAIIPGAAVEVATDLLAAARALCGHEPGVACILGTGSNSCYYDGKEIVRNVSPLGYILGDEGSGAVLGKLLVGDVLKHQLPADLCDKFLEQYGLDRLEIINRVYRQPQANKFLASLSPFLKQNIDREEVHSLVVNAFRAFFRRNVCAYTIYAHIDRTVLEEMGVTEEEYIEFDGVPVANFVGSIAYYYQDELQEAAAYNGVQVGKVLKSPMAGLIDFHKHKI